MNKKILVPLGLLAVGAIVMFLPKAGGVGNDLEKKRKGETPLSDAEAQNLLNTYSDLPKYWTNNPQLADEFGNVLEWVKAWWKNHGIADGRTFESKVPLW